MPNQRNNDHLTIRIMDGRKRNNRHIVVNAICAVLMAFNSGMEIGQYRIITGCVYGVISIAFGVLSYLQLRDQYGN